MAKLILSKGRKNIDGLHFKYALSDKEVEDIGQTIIETYATGKVPENSPTVIILGGQPGAGKSELITKAQKRLTNNAGLVFLGFYFWSRLG